MADRGRAVGALIIVAVAMIVFILYQVADAFGSGGFAPLSVVPALVPPLGCVLLATGLRRGSRWARLGARVLAVTLAAVGAAAAIWFSLTSAMLGPAVASAGPVVAIIVAITATSAILLWRGAGATSGLDARR